MALTFEIFFVGAEPRLAVTRVSEILESQCLCLIFYATLARH
jgi:hypothetical protein